MRKLHYSYRVSICGWHKDQINDDILHKWDFGSEFYEDVDSAIKKKRRYMFKNRSWLYRINVWR